MSVSASEAVDALRSSDRTRSMMTGYLERGRARESMARTSEIPPLCRAPTVVDSPARESENAAAMLVLAADRYHDVRSLGYSLSSESSSLTVRARSPQSIVHRNLRFLWPSAPRDVNVDPRRWRILEGVEASRVLVLCRFRVSPEWVHCPTGPLR
ncbi:hypothetical protein GY45DRAFT_58360 [Cubamyces sp. BRFM 1775]|nr:hypothetical protein GY45DRAFT_58360 [Cubamyces sp. BRFM 1775]